MGNSHKNHCTVAAILVGERDCRTQFWKRTIQWLFRQSLVLIELLVPDKMVFMWISHRVLWIQVSDYRLLGASGYHCIVCPSIYGFWLPLWYLKTLLYTQMIHKVGCELIMWLSFLIKECVTHSMEYYYFNIYV
jgi:hypothetical protein